jgi:hypothetical protein
MKRIFLRKMLLLPTMFALLIATLCLSSCGDAYDNIKEFSMKEVVYPAHFDTIIAYPGYERVEIDLVKEGRLPAYLMNLGKAKTTIVEYDTISKKYDSICSWVAIDSLKLSKLYRFRVYTADEFGNRSTPMEVALTPFTAADKEALGVTNPEMLSLASFVVVRWPNGLSSDILDYLSLSYSYTDKDGRLRTGTTRRSQFFVNNIREEEEVVVDVSYWVFPKLGGERILDSVVFERQMFVQMSAGSDPIEFEVEPSRIAMLPGAMKIIIPNIDYGVTWSSSNTSVATVNVNGAITARAPGTAVITAKTEAIENASATVTVIVPDVSTIPAGDKLAGIWSFEDENDLVKASLGLDLEPFGNNFTSIAGPHGTRGVQFGEGSFYTVKHEMAPNGGGKNINEYTMMMDVMTPSSTYSAWKSMFNTQSDNTGNGIVWTANGDVGHSALGETDNNGFVSAVLQPDTWHRVVFVAQLAENKRNNAFRLYVDGEFVWEASAGIEFDGILSLYTDGVYIGYDNRGTGLIAPNIADLRIWSVRLTDAQIKSLGKP